ncbi:MAG: hypothetical protein R6V43_05730 [Halopseudomonas sp.]
MKHRITRRHSLKLIGATLAAMRLPSVPLLASTSGRRMGETFWPQHLLPWR